MMSRHIFRNLFLAGLAGEIAFEIYAWLISPLLFGVALAPANLVVALIRIGFGIPVPYWAGFILHVAIGTIGFSGFLWMTHLILKRNLVLAGAIAGLILWFVAQGLLAPLVGRSFMMGFGAYTQSSLVGHIGMAMLMGYVMASLQARKSRNGPS